MKRSLILSLAACSALTSVSFAQDEGLRFQREQCLTRIQELEAQKAAVLNQHNPQITRAQAAVGDLGARARNSMSESHVALAQVIARRIAEPVGLVNFFFPEDGGATLLSQNALSSYLIDRSEAVERIIRAKQIIHNNTPLIAELNTVVDGLNAVINSLTDETQRSAVRSGLAQVISNRFNLIAQKENAEFGSQNAASRKAHHDATIEDIIMQEGGNSALLRALVADINGGDDFRLSIATRAESPYFSSGAGFSDAHGHITSSANERTVTAAFERAIANAKGRIYTDMALLSDKNSHFFNIMGGNLDRGRHAAVQLRYGSVAGVFGGRYITPMDGVDFYYYKQGKAEACHPLRGIRQSEPSLTVINNNQNSNELQRVMNRLIQAVTGEYRGWYEAITDADIVSQDQRMEFTNWPPIVPEDGLQVVPNNIAVCSIIDLSLDGLPVHDEVRFLQVGYAQTFPSALATTNLVGGAEVNFKGSRVATVNLVRDNLIPSCKAVYDESK